MIRPVQNRQLAQLITPFPKDRLVLTAATITEALGRPFEMEIEVYSERPLTLDPFLAKNVTLRLNGYKSSYYFNGHIFRITAEEPQGRLWPYVLSVRPWIWFLTRTSDCRIYQNRSVPQIVTGIFREHGYTDFRLHLHEEYPPLEYCVQYRETDFDFIHRLLEQEGIYYYFEHQEGKHTLVLADAPDAHPNLPLAAAYGWPGGVAPNQPVVQKLEVEKMVRPGRLTLRDYDFEKPRADLESRGIDIPPHDQGEFELYDYPGNYRDSDQGERYARVHMERQTARYETLRGQSDAMDFSAGWLFDLSCADAEQAANLDGRYLLTQVTHQITIGDYYSGSSEQESYHNHFTAIPALTPYRPVQTTPKPVIQGPQTAVVVGPKGEEIHTDRYGRVKVQFHWDRYGKRDENSSCWIRVAQLWAGKKWGAIHLPRIGQEVIVEFLEGDPDRPLITGRVYNGEQMPPYDLPAHKSRSGIKSRSLDGSPANYNEIRFEDEKGREEIHIHAERNLRTTVENDERHFVGGNRTRKVKGNEKIQVEKDRHLDVDQNQQIHVTMNHSFKVDLNETHEVGVMRTVKVGAGEQVTVGGAGRLETINGPHLQTVNGPHMQTVNGTTLLTYNGPALVMAPAGYTLIAPGGTNIIDNSLVKVGGQITEGYQLKLNVNFNVNEVNINKNEAAGMVFSYTGISGSTTSVELETATTRTQKAIALALLSSATDIELDNLKILL